MTIIEMMEFPGGFSRRIKIHDNRRKFTNRRTDHQSAIRIPERKLPVILVIIIHHKGIEIMKFNKGPETGGCILVAMLPVMFNQYRYFQQVMELRKGEHINADEEYAGETFHPAKILKQQHFGLSYDITVK